MAGQFVAAILSLAVLAPILMPSVAAASRIEFTPVVARVEPTASQLADGEASATFRQKAFTCYGGQLSWWATPRVAVETGMMIGSSDMEIIVADPVTLHAQMIYLDARVRVRLGDPAAASGIDLIGGLSLSNLDEPFSEIGDAVGVESPTVLGGVVGVSATAAVTDDIRLRFDLVDYFHGTNLEFSEDAFGVPVDGNSQQDLAISVGLVLDIWQE